MISIYKESDEVLYHTEEIVQLTISEIEEFKKQAMNNSRHRIRLCAHRHPENSMHEMFIVHASDCYVRPHKHLGKAESMTVLQGVADIIMFTDEGAIFDIIEMGAPGSGKVFYYRLDKPIFHSMLIKTDFLVFYEATEGPFKREMTAFPDWAPIEGHSTQKAYIEGLEKAVLQYKKA